MVSCFPPPYGPIKNYQSQGDIPGKMHPFDPIFGTFNHLSEPFDHLLRFVT